VPVFVPEVVLEGGMKRSLLIDFLAFFLLRRTTKHATRPRRQTATTPPTMPEHNDRHQ